MAGIFLAELAQRELVFCNIGQVRKITKRANHAYGLATAEVFQGFIKRLAGFGIGIAVKGNTELANVFDQSVGLGTFLFANGVA